MTVRISAPQTLLTETAAPAAGAYAATSVFSVAGFRNLTLWLNADCAAAAGYIVAAVRFSPGAVDTPDATPAFGDDVWYPVMFNDGAPVATLYTGTRATGVDYTGAPEWGALTIRPGVLRFEAHDAASNEIRGYQEMAIPAGARWCSIEYAEVGTTGTPSAIAIVVSMAE